MNIIFYFRLKVVVEILFNVDSVVADFFKFFEIEVGCAEDVFRKLYSVGCYERLLVILTDGLVCFLCFEACPEIAYSESVIRLSEDEVDRHFWIFLFELFHCCISEFDGIVARFHENLYSESVDGVVGRMNLFLFLYKLFNSLVLIQDDLTFVLRDKVKTLSTGERKLLNTAKGILLSELALATQSNVRDMERRFMDLII